MFPRTIQHMLECLSIPSRFNFVKLSGAQNSRKRDFWRQKVSIKASNFHRALHNRIRVDPHLQKDPVIFFRVIREDYALLDHVIYELERDNQI